MSRDPADINCDPTLPLEPWGRAVNVGRFLGDVVRLMAYICVGPDVASIWRREESALDERLERFRGIVEAHAKGEIPRLLISIAAMLRTKLDDGSWKAGTDEKVGWLSQGEAVDPERGEALNVREACDKIIHAKKVRPEHATNDYGMKAIGAVLACLGIVAACRGAPN